MRPDDVEILVTRGFKIWFWENAVSNFFSKPGLSLCCALPYTEWLVMLLFKLRNCLFIDNIFNLHFSSANCLSQPHVIQVWKHRYILSSLVAGIFCANFNLLMFFLLIAWPRWAHRTNDSNSGCYYRWWWIQGKVVSVMRLDVFHIVAIFVIESSDGLLVSASNSRSCTVLVLALDLVITIWQNFFNYYSPSPVGYINGW